MPSGTRDLVGQWMRWQPGSHEEVVCHRGEMQGNTLSRRAAMLCCIRAGSTRQWISNGARVSAVPWCSARVAEQGQARSRRLDSWTTNGWATAKVQAPLWRGRLQLTDRSSYRSYYLGFATICPWWRRTHQKIADPIWPLTQRNATMPTCHICGVAHACYRRTTTLTCMPTVSGLAGCIARRSMAAANNGCGSCSWSSRKQVFNIPVRAKRSRTQWSRSKRTTAKHPPHYDAPATSPCETAPRSSRIASTVRRSALISGRPVAGALMQWWWRSEALKIGKAARGPPWFRMFCLEGAIHLSHDSRHSCVNTPWMHCSGCHNLPLTWMRFSPLWRGCFDPVLGCKSQAQQCDPATGSNRTRACAVANYWLAAARSTLEHETYARSAHVRVWMKVKAEE